MGNKYSKLISNTLIFAIGSFGSKLMVFFLLPLYTSVLNQTEYGTASLVADTASMIIPIVTVSITNGIIRYGLDKSTKKSDVFSVGMITTMIGFALFLMCYPLVAQINIISDYMVLLYLYVLMSAMNSVCAQYVRSCGKVRLYAIDGIFNTLCLIGLNLLFLLVFKLGVTGYILSTIVADGLSVVFLFFMARLRRQLHFKGISKGLPSKMLIFSLPMIPNALCWWITNLSDRYLVTWMISIEANGLYTSAYKIPTAITMISAIFTQAWQMSAISEYGDKNDKKFYATVFSVYQTVVFMSAAVLILLVKPITSVLLNERFYASWQYVPFLVMSVVFSCFAGYYSSIYMATKKNMRSMFTTLLGAVTNIALNLALIPLMGIQGAALATFISYFVVYVTRALDVRRMMPFRASAFMVSINTILLLAETITIVYFPSVWLPVCSAICVVMLIANLKQILFVLYKFMTMAKKRFAKKPL